MNRLVGLLVLLALAYFGYTWLWPRVEGNFERTRKEEPASRDEEAARMARKCVAEADGLNDLVAGEIRALRPGTDPAAWSTVFLALTSETARVRSLCACAAPACGKAAQVADELEAMVLQFNSALRGDPGGWSNPATRQERVSRLLDEARVLLVE